MPYYNDTISIVFILPTILVLLDDNCALDFNRVFLCEEYNIKKGITVVIQKKEWQCPQMH